MGCSGSRRSDPFMSSCGLLVVRVLLIVRTAGELLHRFCFFLWFADREDYWRNVALVLLGGTLSLSQWTVWVRPLLGSIMTKEKTRS